MKNSILFDHGRTARIGLPEAVFCQGKSDEAMADLLTRFPKGSGHPILFTRLSPAQFDLVSDEVKLGYDYHPLSGTAFGESMEPKTSGKVVIVSAGTADGSVAWEASRTLTYLGIENQIFEDCGVAGLWRLTERLDDINSADAVIVVAGLDAALLSVMGGLTSSPLFGVPTSVGYGVAEQGRAALSSMLTSCAPGVGILNIDNGYGAACAAARIINRLAK